MPGNNWYNESNYNKNKIYEHIIKMKDTRLSESKQFCYFIYSIKT